MFEMFANFPRLHEWVDILLVALLFFWVLHSIRGSRALSILLGLALLIGIYFMATFARFLTLKFVLTRVIHSLPILIIVLFQADIRRALAQVGSNSFFSTLNYVGSRKIFDEIVRAVASLAHERRGALIVLERTQPLNDYIDIGTEIEARVSKEILTTLFLTDSVLHDGAVIIQKGRITAAGCILPLSMNPNLSKNMGTRHRAAMGLTEETDAVAIVVSEEQGKISLVVAGRLTRDLDTASLRKVLISLFTPKGFSLLSKGVPAP